MSLSSPTPPPTWSLHPLDPSTTDTAIASSSTSSRAPSPIQRGVRNRKPTPLASVVSPSAPHADLTPCTFDDPADVTRPNLTKATKDALGLAGQGSSSRENESPNGKQRQPRTRAASEAPPSTDPGRDREVVVHTVLKTDTIASVSLQYGISQQALRKANRLWATDPIHLRPNLLVPLDECNLPSSSFGLERIAREENGDITVWKREAHVPKPPSKGVEGEGLKAASRRSQREDRIVSPTARRLISTSSFETSPNPPSSDFLAIWDEIPPSSSRPSLDSVRSSTGSFSSQPSSTKPSFSPRIISRLSLNDDLQALASEPYFDSMTPSHSSPPPLLISVTPDHSSHASNSFSRAPSASSLDTTPPSDLGSLVSARSSKGQEGGGSAASSETLSKRTLKVQRLPASQLSFFPPPNPSNKSLSSPPPPPPPPRHTAPSSTHHSLSTTTTSATRTSSNGSESEDLFFRPLANTLTNSFPSLKGLNKYLSTPFTSSSSSSTPFRGGSIALPLSRTCSPHRNNIVDNHPSNSSNGWNLDFFGGEEELAAGSNLNRVRRRVNGSGGIGEDQYDQRERGRKTRGRALERRGNGGGSVRRTSEIGLEQVQNRRSLSSDANAADEDESVVRSEGENVGTSRRTNRVDARETFGLI